MKRFAACVAVVVFICPIALAQAPAAAKEQSVAMLSVVVTDSRGKHVPSLTKDDFQLAIGGTPLDIEKFAERGAAGTPAGEMRRIAVLFDVTTLSAGARRQTSDALHGFLSRTLRPGDMAVILASGQSLRAMTGWTDDLKEIDAALQQVSGEASTSLSRGQDDAERRIREIAADIRQAGSNAQPFYTFDSAG